MKPKIYIFFRELKILILEKLNRIVTNWSIYKKKKEKTQINEIEEKK